jgi:nucleoside-diphosphate-sugar epimerase
MKVIITGATGGLGRNLVLHVKQLGWEIIALGRNESIGKTLGVTFKSVDLSDEMATQSAFESADVVFHCAALSSPWGSDEAFYRANVLATHNVIDAMIHHTIPKIVHVSTPSIYFDYNDQMGVSEAYVAKTFVNAYAKTKYEAEQIVLQSDMISVILRPRGIFGEHDQALMPRVERIARKGFLPLIKGKEAVVDITYVGNVVHALCLAATKEVPSKSIFNITNDEPKAIREIFELVVQTLGLHVSFKKLPYGVMMGLARFLEIIAHMGLIAEPPLTRYGVGLIATHQTLDIQKAKEMLGYRPIFTIEEGMKRYASWRNKTL